MQVRCCFQMRGEWLDAYGETGRRVTHAEVSVP